MVLLRPGVLWLDAVARRWVEEMGGVNLFFVRPEVDAATGGFTPAHRLAMPGVWCATRCSSLATSWSPSWSITPGSRPRRAQRLYLRPFMIATEAQDRMRPAFPYLFLLIAFPVTPFFPGEVKPVTVWLSDEYVRAAVGGTGRRSAPGTTPAACSRSARPPSRAATRWCGSTRSNAGGSRRWAG